MTEKSKLDNERDQSLRLSSIDIATRVVGKPVFLPDNTKQQDDVVAVAKKIYDFIMGQ